MRSRAVLDAFVHAHSQLIGRYLRCVRVKMIFSSPLLPSLCFVCVLVYLVNLCRTVFSLCAWGVFFCFFHFTASAIFIFAARRLAEIEEEYF